MYYELNTAPARYDSPVVEIDEECATWDWARTAGVSALELRMALFELLNELETI